MLNLRDKLKRTEVVLLLLLVVGFFCIFPPSLNYGDHSSWGIVFQENLINFFNLQNLEEIQVIGLPLAISLSAIFQFLILFFLFWKKIYGKPI